MILDTVKASAQEEIASLLKLIMDTHPNLIEALENGKVAFNFVGANLFPKRKKRVFFGKSFRDSTKELRDRGQKIVYHDFEELFPGGVDDHYWNLPEVFARDFSMLVTAHGTCVSMPGMPVSFRAPEFKMHPVSLQRGIERARMSLPDYYHMLIMLDPMDMDNGSAKSAATAIQNLVPTYCVSQSENISVDRQVISLLQCCVLKLELDCKEGGMKDRK